MDLKKELLPHATFPSTFFPALRALREHGRQILGEAAEEQLRRPEVARGPQAEGEPDRAPSGLPREGEQGPQGAGRGRQPRQGQARGREGRARGEAQDVRGQSHVILLASGQES